MNTDIIDRVLDAREPSDLFGDAADEAAIRVEWRRLAKLVHPDRHGGADAAERATSRLNELFEQARDQLLRGRYGSPSWGAVTRKGRRYQFDGRPTWRGDSCDLFLGERLVLADRSPVWVKVARSPRDNDLLANEMQAIRRVLAGKSAGENSAHLYVAPLCDSFQVTIERRRHRANVFDVTPGMLTMQDVRRAFPGGVHPKDAAWMFRRTLWGLGCAHDAGVVHGAVLPQHLLLTPEEHGVTLLDWRAASIDGRPIAVLSSGAREFYPAGILNKEEARPGFDIAMAAACMEWVCGGRDKLPRPLRGFFKGCRAPALPDAWELRREFTALIEAIWGPRTFRPFIVPGVATTRGA